MAQHQERESGEDAGSYTVNLPPLEFPLDIELAARYRDIIGTLEDGVDVHTAEDHFNTHNQGFSVVEKSLASLGFHRAVHAVRRNQDIDLTKLTLGDIRRLSPADIVASKMISFRRALIFLHGIQSQNPSTP